MSTTILRGRVLSFVARPTSVEDDDSFIFHEDGGVALADGFITGLGSFSQVMEAHPDASVKDHRPHLILPGLIDTHLHFPQMQVIGSFGTKLLDWLNKYTFVEEQKFSDPDHCERFAGLFFDTMLRHGTTTAVAYCSVHKTSAEAFLARLNSEICA